MIKEEKEKSASKQGDNLPVLHSFACQTNAFMKMRAFQIVVLFSSFHILLRIVCYINHQMRGIQKILLKLSETVLY